MRPSRSLRIETHSTTYVLLARGRAWARIPLYERVHAKNLAVRGGDDRGLGCVDASGAQQSGDKWDVFVAPYLLGAAMSGTTTVRGDDVDVDLSVSDIFSNLQFGAMGMVVARKGNWGFGTDLIWMALGTTVREVNVDFNQGAFAFYGLRALGPAADLTFGMRVNTLQGKLAFKTLGVDRDQDKTWVDPIVGLTLHSPAGRRVHRAALQRNRRLRRRVRFHVAALSAA